MRAVKKLEAHLEQYVMGVLLIGITLILMMQIVMRLLKLSLAWPEELARYLYIWSVLLSLGYTIRSKSILNVDLLLNMLPAAAKRATGVLLQVVSAAFYLFLCYYSVYVVGGVRTSGQTTPALEWPMYIIYLAIPAGFFLAAVRSVQQSWWLAIDREPEIEIGADEPEV